MTQLVKTKCRATFTEDEGEDITAGEEIEIEVGFEGDCFFIDGLRDGEYLSLPLHALAQAMADSTRPPAGRLAS